MPFLSIKEPLHNFCGEECTCYEYINTLSTTAKRATVIEVMQRFLKVFCEKQLNCHKENMD